MSHRYDFRQRHCSSYVEHIEFPDENEMIDGNVDATGDSDGQIRDSVVEESVPEEEDLDNEIQEMEAEIANMEVESVLLEKQARWKDLRKKKADLAAHIEKERSAVNTSSRPASDAAQSVRRKTPASQGDDIVRLQLDDIRKNSKVARKADRQLKELNVFASSVETSADESSEDERDGTEAKLAAKKSKTVKSGKNLKISSNVVQVEKWPHVYLSVAQYAKKDRKYEDLTIEEFVAGYAAILAQPDLLSDEVAARVNHLQRLMYLAMRNTWKSVLFFHSVCLLQIERRLLKWGDNFSELESISLECRQKLSKFTRQTSSDRPSDHQMSPAVVYCMDYQKGTCNQSESHYGLLFNRKRYLQHVCSTCLKATGKSETHNAGSENCPLKSD